MPKWLVLLGSHKRWFDNVGREWAQVPTSLQAQSSTRGKKSAARKAVKKAASNVLMGKVKVSSTNGSWVT